MSVVIETTIGCLTIDLYCKERPQCSFNFLKLCKMKYYNFSLFHFVEHNFIAQTGKPWSESQYEGFVQEGLSIFSWRNKSENLFRTERKPQLKHQLRGTVSMVNNGDGLLGSQFFITLADKLDTLDQQHHCVFAEVVLNFDDKASDQNDQFLNKLNSVICDKETKCPLSDIRILYTVCLIDPYPDPKWLTDVPRPQSPSLELLKTNSNMIGIMELVDESEGLSLEELKELQESREAANRAKVLAIIGDLPDAEVKPPENVLFVCRLNPVTTDDDLHIIFSRFGHILSCEIIRDGKTNNSLCYAFIEFENKEDCERAYFRMDNVLIDDRRIHVDFCQSVAKVDAKLHYDVIQNYSRKRRNSKL
ncbi:hypothetical protein GJ496_003133 [Pomphorhynchus laevis]|nr:hypothetical protein GJ496_003133 [Pomphorhynchus laevis]